MGIRLHSNHPHNTAGWSDNLGTQYSAFNCSSCGSLESWTMGTASEFTSVFQALGGTPPALRARGERERRSGPPFADENWILCPRGPTFGSYDAGLHRTSTPPLSPALCRLRLSDVDSRRDLHHPVGSLRPVLIPSLFPDQRPDLGLGERVLRLPLQLSTFD
jgi:hypothetical protein